MPPGSGYDEYFYDDLHKLDVAMEGMEGNWHVIEADSGAAPCAKIPRRIWII
jgi:hypothetical protein